MLCAVQGAEPAERAVDDLEVAAVALAEQAALDMGRLELAAVQEHAAVGGDHGLGDVEAAVVLLAVAERDGDAVLSGGAADRGHPVAVGGERGGVVAADVGDLVGDCAQPQEVRVAGNPYFGEGDERGPAPGRFRDQVDGLGDPGLRVEPGGLGLDGRGLEAASGLCHVRSSPSLHAPASRSFSTSRPRPRSRRSVFQGASSATPTGSPGPADRTGTVRPGRAATLPGPVLRMYVGKVGRASPSSRTRSVSVSISPAGRGWWGRARRVLRFRGRSAGSRP